SFNAFSASGRGSVFGSKPTSTQADNSMSWSGSSSVSSGYNEYYDSHDYGKKFWADINGDGLPDRIERDDAGVTKVRLNTGKQLSNPAEFQNLTSYRSHPVGGAQFSIGGSLSQNVIWDSLSSLGFGLSASTGQSSSNGTAEIVYEDINGDGLIDILEINNNNHTTTVRYNLGNQFDTPKPLMKASSWVDFGNETTSYNSSLSFGGHLFLNIGPIPILPIITVLTLYIKGGAGANMNLGIN